MMDFEGNAHYPIALETLPRGWSAAFLEDICTSIQSGFASGEHNATGDGIPHVRPMNINRLGQLVFDEVKYVRVKDDRRLMRGDVVFNNTNSPVLIGKTAAVSTDEELAFSNHMTRLRPVDGLDHRFLSNQLHYLWMAGFFLHRCVKHVNQASVSSETLGSTVPVVLPPSPEQHRIVAAIESYFTRLDDAVATLERVQRNLKRYRASVLKAAVEGRLVPTEAELARAEGRSYEPASVLLTRILAERRRRWEEAELAKMTAKGKAPNDDKWKAKYVEPVAPDTSDLPELPEGWCWASVEQLGFIASGQTPSGITSAGAAEGAIPWFRVGDMNTLGNESQMNVAKEWLTADQVTALGLHVRPAGTIIFPKRGGAIGTNKKRLLARPSTYDLNTMGVVPIGGVGDFLWLWFKGVDLGSLADGSNVPQINHGDIAPLAIRLPPEAEQARIVDEVNALLSVAEDAISVTSANRLRAVRLRQSILKWTFEGRLVDQDPTDEPASVLLERIRAERASATDKPPRLRRARAARKQRA